MKYFNNLISNITSYLIILISIVGASNAILRYLGKFIHLNLSSNFFIELQWFLFSIIFLLGASVTFIQDKHIRVDVFYSKFSKKKKRKLNIFGTLFFLIPFCLIISFFSIKYFLNSVTILEQSSEPNGIPRYIIKLFIPLGFLILLINAVKYLINTTNNDS